MLARHKIVHRQNKESYTQNTLLERGGSAHCEPLKLLQFLHFDLFHDLPRPHVFCFYLSRLHFYVVLLLHFILFGLQSSNINSRSLAAVKHAV